LVIKTTFEELLKEIGNALIVKKRLENYLSSLQKIGPFIAGNAGKKREAKDKFLRHGEITVAFFIFEGSKK